MPAKCIDISTANPQVAAFFMRISWTYLHNLRSPEALVRRQSEPVELQAGTPAHDWPSAAHHDQMASQGRGYLRLAYCCTRLSEVTEGSEMTQMYQLA